MDEIINKVAGSGIVTIDLEQFAVPGERVFFDVKPLLFMEQVLREKDLRDFIRSHDWTQYADKIVGIFCSADAIVPTWAYMLLSLAFQPYASKVHFAGPEELEKLLFSEKLASVDWAHYKNARVVIKGCGDVPVPVNAFVMVATALAPWARSIMYGEPCSTVPLFKSKPEKR